MLGKLRDISDTKEQAALLAKTLESQQQDIAALKGQHQALSLELESLREGLFVMANAMQQSASEFNKATEQVKELSRELQQDIVNVQMLRGQLQSKIAEKVGVELSNVAKETREKLAPATKVAEDIKSLSSGFAAAQQELKAFSVAAAQIREKDFEFNNFLRELKKREDEKLQLVRKVDQLERLAAKMRRRQ